MLSGHDAIFNELTKVEADIFNSQVPALTSTYNQLLSKVRDANGPWKMVEVEAVELINQFEGQYRRFTEILVDANKQLLNAGKEQKGEMEKAQNELDQIKASEKKANDAYAALGQTMPPNEVKDFQDRKTVAQARLDAVSKPITYKSLIDHSMVRLEKSLKDAITRYNPNVKVSF
jgi:hypothetical protein